MKKIYLLCLLGLSLATPMSGQLLLNEILYDPSNSGLDGDANGDGAYSQAEDEFLELINTGSTDLDISGYKIYDAENLALATPNHTVPDSTVIPAGGAYVLFGGGTPTGTFGGAVVQTSTFGDLNMNNSGDTMYVFNANDSLLLSFDIEPLSNNPNESYTRFPDITGNFIQHNDSTPLLFSPGLKVDGTPFPTVTTILVREIAVNGMNGDSTIQTPGGTLQMVATLTPTNATDSTVSWSVSPGTGDATIDSTGLLTAVANGTVTVTATANDGSGISGSTTIAISFQNTGIDEVLANQSLRFYPNPATNLVEIETPEPIQQLELYTLSGRLLQRTQPMTTVYQLPITDLQAGLYLLRVRSGDTWRTGRLIKE